MKDRAMGVSEQIENTFPSYRSDTLSKEWISAIEKYPLGAKVTGKIALVFDFGYVVDIGLPFPAMMLLGRFPPKSGGLSIGEKIEANIYVFDEVKNQIGVTQTGKEEWMLGNW